MRRASRADPLGGRDWRRGEEPHEGLPGPAGFGQPLDEQHSGGPTPPRRPGRASARFGSRAAYKPMRGRMERTLFLVPRVARRFAAGWRGALCSVREVRRPAGEHLEGDHPGEDRAVVRVHPRTACDGSSRAEGAPRGTTPGGRGKTSAGGANPMGVAGMKQGRQVRSCWALRRAVGARAALSGVAGAAESASQCG
jgi:hypothetical protein